MVGVARGSCVGVEVVRLVVAVVAGAFCGNGEWLRDTGNLMCMSEK